MDSDGKWKLKPIFYDISEMIFNNNTLAKVYFNENVFFYIDKNAQCVEHDGVMCPEE